MFGSGTGSAYVTHRFYKMFGPSTGENLEAWVKSHQSGFHHIRAYTEAIGDGFHVKEDYEYGASIIRSSYLHKVNSLSLI